MDFLTQPFNSPSPPPPSPLVSTSNRVSDGSSILTTSTTDTTQARQESNAAFQHLRATPQASLGIPDETPISLPSVKNGDWRAYGRVQANVVLWQDGVLGTKKKLSTDQIEEEWSVTGSLWFTKNRETILLLDRSVPPQEIARNQPKPAPATSRRLSFGRLRSVSPTSTRDVDTQQANVSTSTNANEDPSTMHQDSGGGFFQKVLDAVRPGRKERRSSGGSDGLSLSRSRSRSRPTEVTHSHGGGPGSIDSPKKTLDTITQDTAHLTFEEPASSRNLSPFPQYKGHSVTALYIASTDHIQSVRFYPQRPISSGPDLGSFFSFAKEAEPLSSPPNSPSLATSSAGGTQFEAPVVELDVIDPAHIGSGGDEGRKRQVTIGLRFVELLCATEAEDFHRLIEAAMSATGDESIPIHRTVSRSLDTNQTQRRKSWGIA